MPTNENLGTTYTGQLKAGETIVLVVEGVEKINYTVPVSKRFNANFNGNEQEAPVTPVTP